jgi:hypothetical protein
VTDYVTPSLWDVEDVNEDHAPAVRDMTVGPATTADVHEFCRRYHYTHSGGSALWRWGLWHGHTLYGVIAYNTPTLEAQSAVFGAEHAEHVWHMGRLVMPDHAPRNSESRLIAGSLTAIQRDYPNVWAVLTYAAQSAGHIGYVYQSTNAIYTGTGGSSTYILDRKGNRRSTNHNGAVMTIAEIARRGWISHPELPKHRYLYILGNRAERRQRRAMCLLPELPYPKDVP